MNAAPLSGLREELDLLAGPVLPDGQPSWTLHDPERNMFFRIDWLTFEILQRWSLGDPQAIAQNITTATTLRPDEDDVTHVARFLDENQLTVSRGPNSARKLAERLAIIQGTPLKWLLHHYLFFRVPLWRPDAWLQRMLPIVAPLYTRGFFFLTLLALLIGLTQVVRHSEVFFTSLVDTFTFQGLAAYGVTLIVVKLLHELGHAFTAKRFGCRIPAIGVAFLVMFPMAYTDTNETWRLTNRWQRLQVSAAGIATELMIAAWSTLAWGLLPDGELRGLAFMLATTSWIATVLINASPFLRFDGYFILSDLLDMPNLHGRSFALARWQLRESLFALGESKPEHFSARKQFWLIVFAWITWIYRLVVFLGIALLVYHLFVKVIGIFLFAVEIWWFIARPILQELQAWRARLPKISANPYSRRRSLFSVLLFTGLVALLFVPWPGRVVVSGLLRPLDIWTVFAPAGAQVETLLHDEGDLVSAGTTIIRMHSPELTARYRAAQAKVESARWQAAAAGLDVRARGQLQVAQQEYATANAELLMIEEQLLPFTSVAPFTGTLRDIDPDLEIGQWLEEREKIAVLVGDGPLLVETYLDEEAVKRVAIGDSAIFIADGLEGGVLSLTVRNIDADATRVLPNGILSAQAGGHILTRARQGEHVPGGSFFRVVLQAEKSTSVLHEPYAGQFPSQAWRGQVIIRADAQAPATRYLRNFMAVLVRESGL
ncbi:MAG: HlyD family efflux transporter periplasmic adaptor subunit [Gammaproteobacteria bacterium]|nr:HlyD family efflux transporter periplasmic adaptor subunit [Gammaproteobacteria bacterium]MDP2140070.1 HlyD family efflux transporter periplasmic adaptor subunit [Gammaproteobacteria bacterium]MDP2347632.1 HlyD family efflux transporter periplasmic adaptor subunit [Gammaproteobacteria bacterium]